MSTATVSDVEGVIDVDLSDSSTSISDFLDDAEFEAKQAINNYSSALTDKEKTQLEKYVAALRIRQWVDRAVSSTSRETASVSYEGPSLSALKSAVDRRDPSDTLARNTDTDRYVNSGP